MTEVASSTAPTEKLSDTNQRSRRALSDLTEDFDSFLKLLTTQLKNQDPTEPMDTKEFTNQIVAFSEVEQSVATNENLENLLTQNQGLTDAVNSGTEQALESLNSLLDLSKLSNPAVAYVGRVIEAEGNITQLKDGQAPIVFQTAEPASAVRVTISDEEGQAIRQIDLANVTDRTQLVWDGLDQEGNQMPEGIYTFSVDAVAEGGQEVETKSFLLGRVDGAEFYDGEAVLQVGEVFVPLSKISAIRAL